MANEVNDAEVDEELLLENDGEDAQDGAKEREPEVDTDQVNILNDQVKEMESKLVDLRRWLEEESREELEEILTAGKNAVGIEFAKSKNVVERTGRCFDQLTVRVEQWDERNRKVAEGLEDIYDLLEEVRGTKPGEKDGSEWEQVAQMFEIGTPKDLFVVLQHWRDGKEKLKEIGVASVAAIARKMTRLEKELAEMMIGGRSSKMSRSVLNINDKRLQVDSKDDRQHEKHQLVREANGDPGNDLTIEYRISKESPLLASSPKGSQNRLHEIVSNDQNIQDRRTVVPLQERNMNGLNAKRWQEPRTNQAQNGNRIFTNNFDESNQFVMREGAVNSNAETLTKCLRSIRTPLPALEKFSGGKGANQISFRDFVEEFEIRYEGESDKNKVRFLQVHLTGMARDAFMGLPATLKEGGNFKSVVEELRARVSDVSKITRMTCQNDLNSLVYVPGTPFNTFFARLDCLVEEAYPSSLSYDEKFIDERKCGVAAQALSQLPGLASKIWSALANIPVGNMYQILRKVVLDYERINWSLKKLNRNFVPKRPWFKQPFTNVNGQQGSLPWQGSRRNIPIVERESNRAGSREQGMQYRVAEAPQKARNFFHERLGNSGSEGQNKGGLRDPVKEIRCFRCNGVGHSQRVCPSASVNAIVNEFRQKQKPFQTAFKPIKVRVEEIERTPEAKTSPLVVGGRPVSKICCEGVEMTALIDTGAMVSTITWEAFKSIPKLKSAKMSCVNAAINCLDASGNEMKIVGEAKLRVSWENEALITNFFIFDRKDASEDVVLGMSALQSSRKWREAAYKLVEKLSVELPILVSKQTIVPSRAQMLVEVKSQNDKEVWGLLAPSVSGVQEGIVKLKPAEVNVVLFRNEEEDEKKLESGEQLGTLSPATIVQGQIVEKIEQFKARQTDVTEVKSRKEKLEKLLQINKLKLDTSVGQKLKNLLKREQDIFALDDNELTQTHLGEHVIDTGDAKPIRQAPRPVPLGIRGKVSEMIKDYLNRGIIRHSNSPWCSPVVLVKKPDGSLRLCVDYRELNKRVVNDGFPLPHIDSLLHSLKGKGCYSKFDLTSGYWQVPLSEDSKFKTAFALWGGQFEFNVLPFGLTTAPSCFERLMETVLGDLIGNSVFVYIDDILVATDTEEEHLKVLAAVFKRLRAARLKLKATKAEIFRSEIKFLGHVLSASGIQVDPEKVEKIQNFPCPKTEKQLRRFLGMCSYYRKFIKDFAFIARPLYNMLKEGAVKWSETSLQAFENMRTILTSAPVLTQPDIDAAVSGMRPFVITTDACSTGMGAVLSQKDKEGKLHPVCFASRACADVETRYHVTDLEALAVVYALRKFKWYVFGARVIVLTDHQPLLSLFTRKDVSNRILRWALELQAYNVQFQYIKGSSNACADTLSRQFEGTDKRPDSEKMHVETVGEILNIEFQESWTELLSEDNEFKPILKALKEGQERPDYFLEGKFLYRVLENGKICKVVPAKVRKHLFEEAHKGLFAGHLSAKKIFLRLQKEFFWPKMQEECVKWHKSCVMCLVHNPYKKYTPPLRPVFSSKVFEICGVDILELGRTKRGNRYVVTIVDSFSKFCAAYPVPDKGAETVAKVLVEEWICGGGRVPRVVLSDRGREFENELLSEVSKLMNFTQSFTVGHNPRENGLTERMNKTLSKMLAKSIVKVSEWDERLPYVLFAYNSTPHSSTGESPFFLMYGMDPNFPCEENLSQTISPALIDFSDFKAALCEGLEEIRAAAAEQIRKAQIYNKQYYDKANNVTENAFKVGDRVMVYMPTEKAKHLHPKLVGEYMGPYRIIQCFDNSVQVRLIGREEAPFRVQIDHLKKVPEEISEEDHYLGMTTGRRRTKGKKGNVKLSVGSIFCNVIKRLNCRSILHTVVQFDGRESPRQAVNIAKSICGANMRCSEKACSNGVLFGSLVDFAPLEIATVPFYTIQQLAKAVTFWRQPQTREVKIHQLQVNPYRIQVESDEDAIKEAAVAVVKSCEHRQKFLRETFGFPLYEPSEIGMGARTMFVNAMEAVREKLCQSLGKTVTKIAVMGGLNAQKLAEVIKEAGWVPVGVNGVKDRLQFANWAALLQPWETGYRTRCAIFMLSEEETEESVAAVKKCMRGKINVMAYVVAPIMNTVDKPQTQIVQKFLHWKRMYESTDLKFVGFDDGPFKVSLATSLSFCEMGLHERSTHPPLLCNGILSTLGAKLFVQAVHRVYNVDWQLQSAVQVPPSENFTRSTRPHPRFQPYNRNFSRPHRGRRTFQQNFKR